MWPRGSEGGGIWGPELMTDENTPVNSFPWSHNANNTHLLPGAKALTLLTHVIDSLQL